jgi:hypothetical protein
MVNINTKSDCLYKLHTARCNWKVVVTVKIQINRDQIQKAQLITVAENLTRGIWCQKWDETTTCWEATETETDPGMMQSKEGH